MSKRLKIYSLMLIGIVVVFVLNNIFHIEVHEYSGSDEQLEVKTPPAEFEKRVWTLPDGTVKRDYKPTIKYNVNVEANGITVGEMPGKKFLFSTVKGQTCQLTMTKVQVEVPATKPIFGPNEKVYGYALWFVQAVVLLWILFLVFRILYNIRRGEIFVSGVAKSIEIAGMLLTFLYIFQVTTMYILAKYMMAHIKLADYHIVFRNEINSMYIITGLALMILSQIIMMGKELKDEQELTI